MCSLVMVELALQLQLERWWERSLMQVRPAVEVFEVV
jgi:hypothetical protein